ncbi:MAG: NUDIX domain-containing protein [Thermomicrobiales bacterium]
MESRIYCQRCGGGTELRPVEDRSRPVCTNCGTVTYFDPKLAVAVVLERDGKILLGQRGQNTRAPGKWSFPAGFVERGEQVEAAAIRETREETGVIAELGPLIGLFSRDGEAVVLAVYAANNFAGEPVASDDLDAVGWFELDALPELAFDHDPAIVRAWKSWFDSVISAG